MMLYIFLGLSAGALVVVPIALCVKLAKKWNIERKIFWKAGLSLLIIQIFFSTVISNASFLLPEGQVTFINLALFALISAMTFELGRFFILDKFMKKIRSFLKGVYFGLGWGGIMTIFLGFALILAIFGIDLIVKTEDLSALVPEDSGIAAMDIEELKEQIFSVFFAAPYLGLLPIIERAGWAFIDVALTLLILFGIAGNGSRYIWGAVLFRGLFTFSTAASTAYIRVDFALQALITLIFAAAAYFIIRKLKDLFTEKHIA